MNASMGVELPEAEGLDDEAFHQALWKVIQALGTLHVYRSRRIISATASRRAIADSRLPQPWWCTAE